MHDASAVERHAGEQSISVSVTATQLRLLWRQKLRRAACKPSRGRTPVRASKAGFEPALSMARSIRNLHHQRRFSRDTRQTGLKTNFIRGALNGAATANPQGLALPSVSGLRLVPSDRPRAFGHTPAGASPGIRVSRSGLRRDVSNEPASDNKKPSGAVGSGGSVWSGLSISFMRDRSHEPGVRHRLTKGHSIL